MKSLKSIFAALSFVALFAMASCTEEESYPSPTTPDPVTSDFTQIQNDWKLISWRSDFPIDINNDGKSSSDLLNEEMGGRTCFTDNIWRFGTNFHFEINEGKTSCGNPTQIIDRGVYEVKGLQNLLIICYNDENKVDEEYQIRE